MCLFPCMTCHVRERIRDTANKRTLTGRKLTAPGLFLHFHCVESPMPGYCGPAAAICVALGAVVAQLPMLPSVLPSVLLLSSCPCFHPRCHRFGLCCSIAIAVGAGLPSAASDSAFIPFSVRDCGFLQSPVEDLFELNRL